MAVAQKRKFYGELPRTKTDIEIPFDFKAYQFKNEGLYFIALNLAIPLLVLIITSLTIDQNPTMFSSINMATSFICLSFSFVYMSLKSTQKLFSSGLMVFYSFILIPNLLVFTFQLILEATGGASQWLTIAQLWIQAIGEIIVIVLAFKWTSGLKNRFHLTLKFSWKWLLTFLIIGVFLMWGTSVLYNLIFQNTVLAGDSNNQNALTDILEHPESQTIKIFYILTLLIFTVGVAPLAEELAFRQAWFTGSGSRSMAFLTAPIYFGYLHVQSGDIEHMLSYVVSGLVLTAIFNSSRGNVVYSWLVHAGSNLLVLILLLA